MSERQPPARVIVCGGRDFNDYARVCEVLDRLHASRPFAVLRHGAARGADSLAGRWARERGVPEEQVPANWTRDRKAAGPIRNQQMLDMGADLVVAFPGGRGTEDMVKRAHTAGVLVGRARAASPLRQGREEIGRGLEERKRFTCPEWIKNERDKRAVKDG